MGLAFWAQASEAAKRTLPGNPIRNRFCPVRYGVFIVFGIHGVGLAADVNLRHKRSK
jgi:hypothetical protein